MYQALYRKWRPRTFDEVVGQKQVTDTLKNQIAAGRISHAYIFVGTRGTGKTTCAKILAKAINCESPVHGNPCNKCKSCLGIESGSVMDVVEIDAASNNGVENVRALRDEAVYTPASVKKRVYIIDEVHMLSTSAFNALLKILEEPPEHLVFILATTELRKVLPTILSRCQRYSFRRVSPEDVVSRLTYVAEREGIALERSAAEYLGRLADGSLRDGLSLLDQCCSSGEVTLEGVLSALGMAGNHRTAQLLEYISAEDASGALELFRSLWQEGKAPATVLGELASLLRDVMITKIAPKGAGLLSGGYDGDTLKKAGTLITESQALSAINHIQYYLGLLNDGRDPRMTAELCILGLCRPELADTPQQLSLRISRLERQMENGTFSPKLTTADPELASVPVFEPLKTSEEDIPPFDIPRPEPQPVQEPLPVVQAAPEPDSNTENNFRQREELTGKQDFWPRLRDELQKTMPAYHFAHLSGARAELDGDRMVITVSNAFRQSKLEATEPREMLLKAIEKVMGRLYPLLIQVGVPADPGNNPLDSLARFGNVEFQD